MSDAPFLSVKRWGTQRGRRTSLRTHPFSPYLPRSEFIRCCVAYTCTRGCLECLMYGRNYQSVVYIDQRWCMTLASCFLVLFSMSAHCRDCLMGYTQQTFDICVRRALIMAHRRTVFIGTIGEMLIIADPYHNGRHHVTSDTRHPSRKNIAICWQQLVEVWSVCAGRYSVKAMQQSNSSI